jgi:peptide/nickel transport system ATP-binding protein
MIDEADRMIDIRGLRVHYPLRRSLGAWLRREPPGLVRAVDGVDLRIGRGEIVALVGESGSGKTTTGRALVRLAPITEGSVWLEDRDVTTVSGRALRDYRRRVQIIFQDPYESLDPRRTIGDQVAEPLAVQAVGTAEERATRVDRALEDAGLRPAARFRDRFPHELSGGQRQRVAIARALASRPKLLVADEPVSMLDVSIRLGVLNLLEGLKNRLSLAILYITHDIASARYFADETLVMYAGRMVEGGDSETVTQSPAHPYTRLLIESAPDPDRIEGGVAGPDEASAADTTGEPPSLIDPPKGCRFHPRCPHAMERCRIDIPPHFDLPDSPGHWAACWLYDAAVVGQQRIASPGEAEL